MYIEAGLCVIPNYVKIMSNIFQAVALFDVLGPTNDRSWAAGTRLTDKHSSAMLSQCWGQLEAP